MAELNVVEKVIALEAVELLRNLNPDQLARIAGIAREESAAAGAVIVEPSKAPAAVFVILDGSIELRGTEGASTQSGKNDVVGAWALFDPEPMRITATALESSRLLRISRDDFYDLLSENAEITAAIFASFVRRFRRLVEGGSRA